MTQSVSRWSTRISLVSLRGPRGLITNYAYTYEKCTKQMFLRVRLYRHGEASLYKKHSLMSISLELFSIGTKKFYCESTYGTSCATPYNMRVPAHYVPYHTCRTKRPNWIWKGFPLPLYVCLSVRPFLLLYTVYTMVSDRRQHFQWDRSRGREESRSTYIAFSEYCYSQSKGEKGSNSFKCDDGGGHTVLYEYSR